jgi:hypothetical protein
MKTSESQMPREGPMPTPTPFRTASDAREEVAQKVMFE